MSCNSGSYFEVSRELDSTYLAEYIELGWGREEASLDMRWILVVLVSLTGIKASLSLSRLIMDVCLPMHTMILDMKRGGWTETYGILLEMKKQGLEEER